jgi:hypothetical protein
MTESETSASSLPRDGNGDAIVALPVEYRMVVVDGVRMLVPPPELGIEPRPYREVREGFEWARRDGQVRVLPLRRRPLRVSPPHRRVSTALRGRERRPRVSRRRRVRSGTRGDPDPEPDGLDLPASGGCVGVRPHTLAASSALHPLAPGRRAGGRRRF